jgi:mRNA-degrading endonuclease RelE of RelBE toxin-antitoxin system
VYTVIILKTPEKYLKKLSGKIAKSIAAKIDLLKTNPYPPWLRSNNRNRKYLQIACRRLSYYLYCIPKKR